MKGPVILLEEMTLDLSYFLPMILLGPGLSWALARQSKAVLPLATWQRLEQLTSHYDRASFHFPCLIQG